MRALASLFFALPIVLSIGVAVYALQTGRVAIFEAAFLALFAIGPTLIWIGMHTMRLVVVALGFSVYVVMILSWSLSWGGLHLLIGLPSAILGSVLTRRRPRVSGI